MKTRSHRTLWVFVEIGVSVHLDNIILVKRRPGGLVTPSKLGIFISLYKVYGASHLHIIAAKSRLGIFGTWKLPKVKGGKG